MSVGGRAGSGAGSDFVGIPLGSDGGDTTGGRPRSGQTALRRRRSAAATGPGTGYGVQRCGVEVRAVLEKWFHNLNSQSKFSRQRQNKIFKIVFLFSDGRTNHVTPTNVKLRSHSFYALKVCEGRSSCLSAPSPVQMLFRQASHTKIVHSLQSKISQNKSSKFRKMEKRVTFLTLAYGVHEVEVRGERDRGTEHRTMGITGSG